MFAGRTPEFSEVVQQKFTQLALEAGVLPDNAVILPQIGNAEKQHFHKNSFNVSSLILIVLILCCYS